MKYEERFSCNEYKIANAPIHKVNTSEKKICITRIVNILCKWQSFVFISKEIFCIMQTKSTLEAQHS